MITGFKHKGLERFFLRGTKAGIQPRHAARLRLILARLHASTRPQDMNLPGLDLHELKGNRQGTWAVKVSGNWRVTFVFRDEDAEAVDYEDYHWGVVMLMHNPPHPGEILRTLCLEPLGLSVTEAAKALGVSRKTLSSLLNGRTGISPEMAIRLSIAFDTSAESWMRQQAQYDLWHAEQRRSALKVQKLSVA
jgi:addiction module HigA family antidote